MFAGQICSLHRAFTTRRGETNLPQARAALLRITSIMLWLSLSVPEKRLTLQQPWSG